MDPQQQMMLMQELMKRQQQPITTMPMPPGGGAGFMPGEMTQEPPGLMDEPDMDADDPSGGMLQKPWSETRTGTIGGPPMRSPRPMLGRKPGGFGQPRY